MAAGVMQYPRKKFLCALSLGRGIRFFAVAYVAHIYGRALIKFFGRYKDPILYALIALAVLAGIAVLVYFKYYRPKRRRQERAAGEPVEEFPIPGKKNQKVGKNSGRRQRTSQDEEKESTRRTA
jgi:hypothetical protein